MTFGQMISTPLASGLREPRSSQDLDWVKTQAPLSKSQRLDIYQSSWWVRLSDSIADDYKAVVRCLGDVEFCRLVRCYLQEYPPHSYTLVHAGDRFPEFLESLDHLTLTLPWISDLARFERAKYQAYYAEDSSPWDPQWLVQLTPEAASTLRLRTQPSVSLLRSEWKIAGILKRGLRNNEGSAKKTGLACRRGASYCVIYRAGWNATYQTLGPLQYRLLQLAMRGATLNEWAECAEAALSSSSLSSSSSGNWVDWLRQWAERGVVFPEY